MLQQSKTSSDAVGRYQATEKNLSFSNLATFRFRRFGLFRFAAFHKVHLSSIDWTQNGLFQTETSSDVFNDRSD